MVLPLFLKLNTMCRSSGIEMLVSQRSESPATALVVELCDDCREEEEEEAGREEELLDREETEDVALETLDDERGVSTPVAEKEAEEADAERGSTRRYIQPQLSLKLLSGAVCRSLTQAFT